MHPPSQALCTYNPRINVKRLKHENPQCQIEWKLQLKQKYLENVIWNACCRLLLRKALKTLIWTGRSVSKQNHWDGLINFSFDTIYTKISIWTHTLLLLGKFWNVQFKLAKRFFSQKIIKMFGFFGKIFSFNTKSTVQITKTFWCVQFQLVKVFLCKKFKNFRVCQANWVNFTRFVPFSIESGTNACVRTSCEHVRTSVRTKTPWKSKSCENVRTSLRTNSLEKTGRAIVRTMQTFHPNSTFGRNFAKKNPQFCPKICIFKFLTENCMGLLKKPNHFTFWPKTTRVCLEICILDFLTDSRPIFPETCKFWVSHWNSLEFSQKTHPTAVFGEEKTGILQSGLVCSAELFFKRAFLKLCQGLEKGLAEKVGKGLAKGWREGLAKGWQRVGGFPCTLQLFNSRDARLEDWVSAKRAGVKRVCLEQGYGSYVVHAWCTLRSCVLVPWYSAWIYIAVNNSHGYSMSLVCSWNEVGDVLCQISSSPFCTRPFWRMPRKKPTNIKKFGGTPPLLDRNHPDDPFLTN